MSMRRIEFGRCAFAVLFLSLAVVSCAGPGSTRSLEQIRAGLDCVQYKEGLAWDQVKTLFGEADEAPPPLAESLFKNARVYRDKTIIFHTETKKIEESGRSRYIEVVAGIDLCKEK
jgi:hypothetical protein